MWSYLTTSSFITPLPGYVENIASNRESLRLQQITLQLVYNDFGSESAYARNEVIDAWSKIVGDFIAAHSVPVALREGVLYVRVLQPALHYELEQISKSEILRKLKLRFGGKTIRDVRFRVG